MKGNMEDLINQIGNTLTQDVDYPIDGTFLYVEAEWQMVDISIFKDLGDRLLFRDPMDDLVDLLLELWEAEAPEKRWSTMQYRITDETFQASFTHEPLDRNESTLDRRGRILQQRYSNKLIEYPPLV